MLRVNQLDALQLDDELLQLLSYQLKRVFQLLESGWLAACRPELELLLSLLVHGLSLHRDAPTPGARLQNLTLSSQPCAASSLRSLLESPSAASSSPLQLLSSSDALLPRPLSARQKLLYLSGLCLLPYLHARLSEHMTLHSFFLSPSPLRRALYGLTGTASLLHRTLQLVNLAAFLLDGRFPTLLLRLLGIRLLYIRSRLTRSLAFDYMHQQLALSVLSELTGCLLPLLPLASLHAACTAAMRFLLPAYFPVKRQLQGGEAEGEAERRDEQGGCGVCGRADCVMSCVTLPCLHLSCYYCTASQMQADRSWACPVCGELVQATERWSEDREAERAERRSRRRQQSDTVR